MSKSQSQGLTPHWRYRDPREAELLPGVSAETLMGHARAFAAWERESGTPGEAQAYDHIERALKGYGYAVERREIEAFISLPLEGRVILPDGAVVEGLTHAFSPSTDGLDAEVVDVGDGNPSDYARAGAAGKIALRRTSSSRFVQAIARDPASISPMRARSRRVSGAWSP